MGGVMEEVRQHIRFARIVALYSITLVVLLVLAVVPGPDSPAPWYRSIFASIASLMVMAPYVFFALYWMQGEVTRWRNLKRTDNEQGDA